MATPSPPGQRSTGDRRTPPSSSIITRNGARKAKIQTRAMSAGAKPSSVVVAAKKKAQMKKKHHGDTLVRDYLQIAMESKMKVKGPTGFVTEPRMVEHHCLWDDKYPECPQRLISVIERCNELKLVEECVQFSPRAASKEELNVLHSPSVYELMETTRHNQDYKYLEEVSSRYDAVYIHPSTHELALIAAGSTIDMVDRIVTGAVQNGFAAVRPPGHHAMRAEPCGYCFYNNVALAAKHAIDKHGLSRILIVDWDVHHGQATQQMFYDDPRVVYFSIHRYEHGAFWPNLKQSNFHYTGCGAGEGFTFNVPLNATGMTDADYLAIWHQLLMPMALEGEMQLSPACYATLLHQLSCACGAVCVVLEGGYCIPSLAEGAALTLRTLLGHPPPSLDSIGVPCDSVRESILNCIYTHKKFWQCYNFQPTYGTDGVPNVSDELKVKHTVLVKWEGDETVPERYETRDCYPVQSEKTISDAMALLNKMNSETDLSLPKHPVCYIYDERMLKHKNICEPGHVECPERIMRIHERHRDYGLLERLHALPAREAAREDLLAVHSDKHLDRLKELATTKLRDLHSQKEAYDSVYFHPDSLESACVAAGSVMQMVDAVVSREAGSGVCVVRPPGHHADEATPSGFCLLNNVAAAAQYAVDRHGLQRVLILDWDVHHGNGTQKITYDSNKILYISIHRYDNGTFFPSSKEANYTAVGAGRGEGYNVNIPWNKRGYGDTEYLAAMTQVVLPVAYEFRPQLVLVSAGFDAAVGDPLGGCKVTPECFGVMTKMLRGLASGRVVVCLEGGYNVTSISYAMTMCTKALLGDPITRYYEPKPTCHPSAIESIYNVLTTHNKYWNSLKFQLALPVEYVIEKPGPSRGLKVTSQNPTNLGNNESQVKDSRQEDSSLVEAMAGLGITANAECTDSEHCGSIDESRAADDTKSQGANSSGPNADNNGPENSDESKSAAGSSETCKRERSMDGAGPSSDIARPSTSAASSDQPGPSSDQPGPSSDQPGPSSDQPGPSSDQPGPSSDQPGPSFDQPGSSFDQPGPSSAQPGPSFDQPGPSCSRPGPSSAPPSFDGPAICRKRFEQALQEKPDDPATLYQLLAQNMGSFIRGDMFAVVPEPWCPHIEELQDVPEGVEFKQGSQCSECHRVIENWVCLTCYNVYCSRYANKHLQYHFFETAHPLAISLSDLSVWCNACDVYLHNEKLYNVSNIAHRCKFGEDMPRRTIDME